MAHTQETHAVTGAFGFSGKYIAARLLDAGYGVRTLTNSLKRPNPFGDRVKAYPLDFQDTEKLSRHLQGVSVLHNTYWVRFNYRTEGFTHSVAVENTLRLFEAARKAGVKRIVHVSITNPSLDSPFEYFRGKAELEKALVESGISHAILRPAVLFGREDILINNIAWLLRKLPVMGVFGDGNYRLQPIHVDDLACLAVEQGKQMENTMVDAIGPETFTYRELVKEIGRAIGKERPVVSVPDWAGYLTAWMLGKLVDDVMLTREEIEGLRADLLCTSSPPAGRTRLTRWAAENSSILGIRYASELDRRRDRTKSYADL